MSSRTRTDQRGSITPLMVGFMLFVLLLVAVVVDASAAFIQRQSLDNVADGAALRGSDAGAAAVQTLGIPEGRLPQVEPEVRAAVRAYLIETGAAAEHPGLQVETSVDAATRTVRVRVSAPLDLPLNFPGAPVRGRVSAESAAVVQVRR